MKRRLSVVLILLIILSACNSETFIKENPIHVISREDGSGTRSSFTTLSGITSTDSLGESLDNTTVEAAITNSTSVVMVGISQDPHAIGYLSLGSLNDSVKAIAIDNVAPTTQHIQQNQYPLARPFIIVVSNTKNPLINDFIDYLSSDKGQEVVGANGYIPNQDTPVYQPKNLEGKIVVGGSSSVSPVMEKLKESYEELCPNTIVEIQQSDSTTGVASVLSGAYDIGMSSRTLKESEIREGLLSQTIATDGIVVIVNHDNPVENMSLEEVRRVFTGENTCWNSLEGLQQ